MRRILAIVAVVSLALTACNANDKSGTPAGQGTAQQGGTLHLLTTSKEVNLDPAKSQSLAISAIHLVLRSLTTWKTSPDAPAELAPDLATDTGTTTDGGKTWKYTLKPGLKYADGTPIKAADVKYGIERSFAPELSGGLGYHKTLLAGAKGYSGPYKGEELASIQTPDDSTIVFTLDKAYGDWPWIVSMPAFAPVPKSADTDPAHYGEKPVSSGPYQVQSNTPGQKIVLSRNPNWSTALDSVRTGLPDTVSYEQGIDGEVINQRLIADAGDDQFAVTASSGASVAAALLPRVTGNPAVKSRLATSPSGNLVFLALNTQRGALKDVNVRKAIEYAVDKQAVQVAAGGPEYGGDIASTLITPGIKGYKKYDLYQAPPSGDPAKAKTLLAQAGVSNLKLVLACVNSAKGLKVAEAVQQGLARVGIAVTIKSYDDDPLFEQWTGNKPEWDITTSGWLPDFPSALGNIQPLFASSEIGNGGFNLPRYSNPAVDAAIAKTTGEADPGKAADQWAALDQQIMADAPLVPLYYGRNAFLHGSKVTNFYLAPYPPYPNTLVWGLTK